jgi:predicted ABC-type ATPase
MMCSIRDPRNPLNNASKRFMPNVYIISGANGSGKTTTAKQILPYFLNVYEYLNADEIAAGLSPFRPESVAIQAGKLMLKRLNYFVEHQTDFAFETTLSGLNYLRFLKKCQIHSYQINLIYFWLHNPDLAIARVRQRVASGGHNIPEETIIRRYYRGQRNLIQSYLALCQTWIIYDNSTFPSQLVATYNPEQQITLYQAEIWEQIQRI